MIVENRLRWLEAPEIDVRRAEYADGRLALVALIPEANEPPMKLTVNLGGDEGEYIALKSYAENEGTLETLTEAGLVKYQGAVEVGYAIAALVSLTKLGEGIEPM